MKIIGAAITFGEENQNICYFISLVDDIKKHADVNDTIAPDSQDPSRSIDERLEMVKIGPKDKKNLQANGLEN